MRLFNRSLVILSVFLLALPPSPARAQSILYWSAHRPLTWEDFKGTRPKDARRSFDAFTVSRLRYHSQQDSSGRTSVTISHYFEADRSWKRRQRLGIFLLNHEQTHFNITELYARKIRQDLEACEAARAGRIVPEWKLVSLYHRGCKAMHRCHRKFDRQTRHSRRKTAERAWEYKIAADLNRLHAYEQLDGAAGNE